jgi:hypothetical protein
MNSKKKPDRTRNERQARRRDREKQWLNQNGWKSWEALHTALMSGNVSLVSVNQEKPFQEANTSSGPKMNFDKMG